MSSGLDAVVVGAGVAGLAAALELQRRGLQVAVVDAADRPGGVMTTESMGGYLFERGPSTVLVRPPLLEFLRTHSLDDLLLAASPASRLRMLFHDGRLVPVPQGPLEFLRTPLLSGRGKLRLMAEPFVRRGDGREESVAEFVARRLGSEVVEHLVGPFLQGIYAGDENQLGADAVFPQLVALEQSHGSILRGALAGLPRRKARGLVGSHSTRNGLGMLAHAMATRIGEALALGFRLQELTPTEQGFRLEVETGQGSRSLEARRVVIATPAPEAALLLRPLDSSLAEALDSIRHAPIVNVAVGVDPNNARGPMEGFGFLVPHDAGLDLMGCLFMSQLFPGRAPGGCALLSCMLGGARRPEVVERPDDRIRVRLQSELEKTLGLREPLTLLGLHRWKQAVPQPGRHHRRLVADLRRRLPQGMALAGSYLEGVSVADSIASGVHAALALTAKPRT